MVGHVDDLVKGQEPELHVPLDELGHLAIGAGTEGVNSVLKFAQYSKDAKRADAQPSRTLPPPPTTAGAAEQLARRVA